MLSHTIHHSYVNLISQIQVELEAKSILCVQFGLHMFWEQLSIAEIQLNM